MHFIKTTHRNGLESEQGGQTTVRRPHAAHQIPCTIFSSTTFPTVDSSATALAATCHINLTVSIPPEARQSRIQPSGQNVSLPLNQRIILRCALLETFCTDKPLKNKQYQTSYWISLNDNLHTIVKMHKHVLSYGPDLALPCSCILFVVVCKLDHPPWKVWLSLFCFHPFKTNVVDPLKSFCGSLLVHAPWTPGWEPLYCTSPSCQGRVRII